MESMEEIEFLAQKLVESDEIFLERLRELRENSGKTQEEVANEMGVSPETVAEMEAYYADPPLSLLRRYALSINIHVEHRISTLDETLGKKDDRTS